MIEPQDRREEFASAKVERDSPCNEDKSQAREVVASSLVGEGQPTNKRKIITAEMLLRKEFPELKYAVQGLLPEGLFLIASPPKTGKSFMVLDIASAVARGGKVLGKLDVAEPSDVLCLILEDGERRLQQRLSLIMGDTGSERLYLATEWPLLSEGGVARIEEWLRVHPQAKLIVIDTLQRVRPREQRGANLYGQDYAALAPLADLAHKHRVCILVVHHTRKSEAEDVFDRVSGTTGLTAAADGTFVLSRERQSNRATLSMTGRDIEERELVLERNEETGGWILLDDVPEEMQLLSPERQAVIEVYEAGMTNKDVAALLGKPENTVKQLMWKMRRDGQLPTGGNLDNHDNPVTPSGDHTQVIGLLTAVTDDNQNITPSFQGDKREVIEVITTCTQSVSEQGEHEKLSLTDYPGMWAEEVMSKAQAASEPDDCSLEAAA